MSTDKKWRSFYLFYFLFFSILGGASIYDNYTNQYTLPFILFSVAGYTLTSAGIILYAIRWNHPTLKFFWKIVPLVLTVLFIVEGILDASQVSVPVQILIVVVPKLNMY